MNDIPTTSTRFIAFLRAINVGGHTVKMEALRGLFAMLGFTRIETFIASGNVIFETATHDAQTLEAAIEPHLHQSLGYAVKTFLRTPSEVAAVAQYQPFSAVADAANHALYVAFLPAPPEGAAQKKLMHFETDNDSFAMHGREVYWLCRTRISDSPITGALLEKTIGMPATMRNVTTIKKLAAKYPAS